MVDLGADFIKVNTGLSREPYLGITGQARRHGIPADGHLPFPVTPAAAAAAGQRTVEHTSGITIGCTPKADSLRAAYAELRKAVPTMPSPDVAIAFNGLVRAACESAIRPRAGVPCERTKNTASR